MFCFLTFIVYLCCMMKKHLLVTIICCAVAGTAFAQKERKQNVRRTAENAVVEQPKLVDSIVVDTLHKLVTPVVAVEPTIDGAMALPSLTLNGQIEPLGYRPWFWAGWQRWDLHPGLNLSLGASVFAQFGKHARHGAGFMQNISAMYAQPLGKKFTVAAGGYLNNVFWGRDNYRNAGLQAIVGYRFNEHWEAYLYGQKSLVSNRLMPYPLYDMQALGDRVGAAVKYNFNPSFSVQVSVEQVWGPNMPRGYYDTFNDIGR